MIYDIFQKTELFLSDELAFQTSFLELIQSVIQAWKLYMYIYESKEL